MFSNGISFLLKGGPLMWPLFACAVISVAVILERFILLTKASAGGIDLGERALATARLGKEREALQLVSGSENPAARLVATALENRHLSRAKLEATLELQALAEIPKLSQRLNILDTIITVSPLLGLLGTVTGMIAAFHVVGDPNNLNSPAAITGGVAEALIATATGLTIAIVTLVAYNLLGERVKTLVAAMELAGTEALQLATDDVSVPKTYETASARA
jgi:biopolymer transport protein ExbB